MLRNLLLSIMISFPILIIGQIAPFKKKSYKLENGQKVKLSKITFADQVKQFPTNGQHIPIAVLHQPDYTLEKNPASYFALEKDSSLVVAFYNNKIQNIKGNDIFIFHIGEMEKAVLQVSKNAQNWIAIGTATSRKPSIALNANIPISENFTFLKITNKNTFKPIFLDAVAAKSRRGRLHNFALQQKLVTTSYPTVVLKLRDDKYIDGDRVRLVFNGQVIAKNKFLTKWGKMTLNLKEGENELVIKANNDGLFQPNTIKVEISDLNARYRNLYRLKKKRSLTFRIIKK